MIKTYDNKIHNKDSRHHNILNKDQNFVILPTNIL